MWFEMIIKLLKVSLILLTKKRHVLCRLRSTVPELRPCLQQPPSTGEKILAMMATELVEDVPRNITERSSDPENLMLWCAQLSNMRPLQSCFCTLLSEVSNHSYKQL